MRREVSQRRITLSIVIIIVSIVSLITFLFISSIPSLNERIRLEVSASLSYHGDIEQYAYINIDFKVVKLDANDTYCFHYMNLTRHCKEGGTVTVTTRRLMDSPIREGLKFRYSLSQSEFALKKPMLCSFTNKLDINLPVFIWEEDYNARKCIGALEFSVEIQET
jgi:hypothetical protein